MKNFQVRLADGVHDTLKQIAHERSLSLTEVIREAMQVYVIGVAYAEAGKRLIWEDRDTGERAEVLIPGITALPARKQASRFVS